MMKKTLYLFVFLVLLFSCKKEAAVIDSDLQLDPAPAQPEETIFEYLNNYNGTFINGWFPEEHINTSACPEITFVEGNSYVIPGGSNKLKINFQDADHNVCNIYYGIVNTYGYYKVPVQSQNNSCDLIVILSQLVKENNFIIKISLEDLNGNISCPYYLPVELKEAHPGKLQISLSFDQHNDLDLHVIEPSGFEIYWHDTLSPNGGKLDLDANSNCVYDSVNNENIYYTENIPLGCFKVGVIKYMQCIPGVNTNFTVTALYEGELVSLLNGSNPFTGTFPDGPNGNVIEVMKFKIENAHKIAHFQYDRYGKTISKQIIYTEK